MKYKALDDGGASRGWPLGKHPSPEFRTVVIEDLATVDVVNRSFFLIDSEHGCFKQSLRLAARSSCDL